MHRMWWTPDGGSQERRFSTVRFSTRGRRGGMGEGDESGNGGIITFVMQPQKNRSTRSEKSRKRQTGATLVRPRTP